jgi:hypothetical protein
MSEPEIDAEMQRFIERQQAAAGRKWWRRLGGYFWAVLYGVCGMAALALAFFVGDEREVFRELGLGGLAVMAALALYLKFGPYRHPDL